MDGMIGKKVGMTRIYNENNELVPVTVIQSGPCRVVQIKTKDNDGYSAVQLGFDEKKETRVNKAMAGHFKKAGAKGYYSLCEFNLEEGSDLKQGDVLSVDMFRVGNLLAVTGISKGKGFQGTVKRHGFAGGPKTHGQSDRHRAPGSIGASSDPSRVFKGMRMSGQMGNKRCTMKNLEIVKVDVEKNLIMVKGAVPGHNSGYLGIRKIG